MIVTVILAMIIIVIIAITRCNMMFRSLESSLSCPWIAQDGPQGRPLPCNRRLDENGFCAACDKNGKAFRVAIAGQTWLSLGISHGEYRIKGVVYRIEEVVSS